MNHLICALLATTTAGAQPVLDSGNPMIDGYLKRLTQGISTRFLDGAKTRAEWEAKLPRLRQEYLDMLGLWPLPEKTPLKATVTGTLEHAGAVIEKLHFQSRPGLYVTGNLYRPKASGGRKPSDKLPAILYVCGHSNRGRDGNKTAFQDHGLWFANNGYICLIIDTLQLGEVAGKHHGTYNLGRMWWQAAGYTSAGVECWNGVRAIDYLVSRPDVDANRIGVTGISGGGAATIWISAADERVKVAVPVSGMSDLESYVSKEVINGHCDCMFLINTYGWEWTTIAALIAPRPMLFANSDNDRIFPMDGNRRIIERLRRVYKMYEEPDHVNDYVSVGGHDYRPDLRIAIFKWLNKHLKNDTGPVKDADFKPLSGKELRVFPEDVDLPKDQINDRVDETFVPRADVKLPEPGKFDEWKAGLMKQLRERSFRAFPERIPIAESKHLAEYSAWLKTEQDIWTKIVWQWSNTTIMIVSDEEVKDGEKWEKELLRMFPEFDKALPSSYSPRGIPNSPTWAKWSPPNYVERSHALLGRTVDTGRVWDICAAVRAHDALREGKKTEWRLIGHGQAGVLAAYAALFEPSIKEIVLIDPPSSHKDGPIFLNVLRVLDIPDALGMLAPRKLTIIGGKDKAFDKTAEIYKRAGAADKFIRK